MRKWYVVQVKYKQEKIAIENLVNQGFEIYLPMCVTVIVRKSKTISHPAPLFKGYMFVKFDITKDRWKNISNTKGVYKLLTSTNDACSALPAGFIDDLRRKEDASGFIANTAALSLVQDYAVGEGVYIKNGIFKGFTGTCQKIEKDKITVLLALLFNKTTLILPKDFVSGTARSCDDVGR